MALLAAGALSKAERAELVSHSETCVACRAKLAEFESLVSGLIDAGQHLPEVEAPVALRRRWVTAVRASARERSLVTTDLLPAWLSDRRVAWGSLAAMWVLVFFFHISAPEAAKPAVMAAAPPSLREAWLALRVEDHRETPRANAISSDPKRQSQPDALPPRSQVTPASSGDWESA